MPATLPSAGVKKRNDESPQGKADPNPGAGDAGWGATGRNRRPERPEMGAQDVVKAHEVKQKTARTPTSTTHGWPDRSPASVSGIGCFQGMGRATDCRDRQEPIVEPQLSLEKEGLQSGWMDPFKPCGPQGQSEWHPQGVAGYCRSDEKKAARNGHHGQNPGPLQLGPPPTREPVRPKEEGNPYGEQERKAWMPNVKDRRAGLGCFEPKAPEPMAPEKLLPQQASVLAPAIQVSRGTPAQEKAKDAVHCAEREESNPAAMQTGVCAARKRLAPSEMDNPSMAQTAVLAPAIQVSRGTPAQEKAKDAVHCAEPDS